MIISEMVTDLCECNPITLALGSNLSTSYKRKEYFKEHFSMVEPIEYVLSAREQRSFQYVPILKSLHEVLKKKEIQDFLTHSCKVNSSSETQYKSFHDGTHFKNNTLLSENNPAISLILYVDDFEVCNPLGTSRNHQVLLQITSAPTPLEDLWRAFQVHMSAGSVLEKDPSSK